MQFDGFKQEGLDFLKQLEINNNKAWFEDHRHIWEEYINNVNKAYVEEMGEHLIALAPHIKALPKAGGSLYKMFRDIRFSKDKTPMKTKSAIIFWQGSGHRMKSPAFYMQYRSHEFLIATGILRFKDELLQEYREYIKIEKNAKALHDILEDIKDKGISLPEQHYKRFPTGFEKENPYSYLSKYNGMLVYKRFKPNKTFLSKRIINHNFKFYDATWELFNWIDTFIKSTK